MVDEPGAAAVNAEEPAGLAPAAPVSPAAPAGPGSGGRSFEQRASLTFKVLAIFATVVMAIVLPSLPNGPGGTIPNTLTFAGAVLLIGMLLVAATSLDRQRPWAIGAARPILGLMLVTGYGGALIGLGQSRFTVPIDALLATWALLGTPAIRPTPWLGLRGVALVAAYLAAAVATYGAQPAFGPGGWFDVHREDLVAAVSADCGPAGAGPPQAIDVTYRWSWRRAAPVPSGFDIIVLTWSGVDEGGQQLYVLGGSLGEAAGGVYPGTGGGASAAMAQEVAQRAGGEWEWGVELAEQQLAPGQIQVRLQRGLVDTQPLEPGPLSIQVTYIHQGVWMDESTYTLCTW